MSLALGALCWVAPAAVAQSPQQGELYKRLTNELRCKPGQMCAQPTHSRSRKRSFTRSLASPRKRNLRSDVGRRQLESDAKRGLTASADVEVYFPYNSADLVPETRRKLDEIGAALNDRSLASSGFAIIGHTDATGSEAYNMNLSERRAAAVRNYLMRRASVDSSRLNHWGRGEEELKLPGNPHAAVNRRVQLVNAGLLESGSASGSQVPGSDVSDAASSSKYRPADRFDPVSGENCTRFSPHANKTISVPCQR